MSMKLEKLCLLLPVLMLQYFEFTPPWLHHSTQEELQDFFFFVINCIMVNYIIYIILITHSNPYPYTQCLIIYNISYNFS